MIAMRDLDATAILETWESGRDCHPLDRSLLLFALASPELSTATLADRSLGERNVALLTLHRVLFGDLLPASVDCPQCIEKLEFSLSAASLCHSDSDRPALIEIEGLLVRLPTTRDLATIAGERDVGTAIQKLLISLIETAGAAVPVGFAEKVVKAFETASPDIDLALDLTCPDCAHRWTEPFDVASYLWTEVEREARFLFDEVDVLARTYGWPERDILSLTPARRAAYLERSLR